MSVRSICGDDFGGRPGSRPVTQTVLARAVWKALSDRQIEQVYIIDGAKRAARKRAKVLTRLFKGRPERVLLLVRCHDGNAQMQMLGRRAKGAGKRVTIHRCGHPVERAA